MEPPMNANERRWQTEVKRTLRLRMSHWYPGDHRPSSPSRRSHYPVVGPVYRRSSAFIGGFQTVRFFRALRPFVISSFVSAAIVAAALLLRVEEVRASGVVIGKGTEVSLGREAASHVERMLPVDRDPVAVAKVRRIGRRLVSVATEKDLPFEFHVVDQGEVNAFALPGGYVYVYRGLLQLLPNDDALAFVVGHEVSHATCHHGIRQWEKNMGLSLVMTAALGGNAAIAQQTVQILAGLKFSRDDEAEADRKGMALVARAGYNLDSAAEAMMVVRRSVPKGNEPPALLRSHPAPDDRIRTLRGLAAEWKERLARDAPSTPPTPVALAEPAFAERRLPGLEGFTPGPCPHQPLMVGARWHYRVSGPAGASATTLTIVEELAARPAGVYRAERDLGRGVRADLLLVASTERLLICPAGSPGSWRVEAPFAGSAEVRDTESGGRPRLRRGNVESVQVPAGTFSAVRVEYLGPDGRPAAISWYAPGVGLVRRQSLSTNTVEELERFWLPPVPEPEKR